jgi:hypothetical protein
MLRAESDEAHLHRADISVRGTTVLGQILHQRWQPGTLPLLLGEDQIEVCRRYAARLGFEVTATFNDRAISGSNNNRPGYQQMLAEARPGSFDVVIVEAVDRLARKLAARRPSPSPWSAMRTVTPSTAAIAVATCSPDF